MAHVAVVPRFLHITGPIHAKETQLIERRQHFLILSKGQILGA